MKMSEVWGIDISDDVPSTRIPFYFTDHYGDVGVTAGEAVLVVHLLQYEQLGNTSPSLVEIAGKMRTSTRTLYRACKSLEDKGLLVVTRRSGYESTYSIAPLMEKCLALSEGV